MLVGMLVVMYFFMIRPQKKQERELADMRNNIQIGDEVVTIGGIIGSVIIIKDDKIMIETGSGSKITILRSAVKTVLKDEEESK
jgi:preprotein translocase subunit YajC